MRSFWPDEAGHTSFFLTALLAAIALVLLTFRLAREKTTLVWIGGIGASALALGLVGAVHAEIVRIGGRLDRLEPRPEEGEKPSRRMLDFAPVWKREITLGELVADLTVADLHELTNDMIDTMVDLIADWASKGFMSNTLKEGL
jgi:hypothetical protein